MKSKEEPKQENCCTPIGQIKRYINCVGCDQKPKQDTVGKEFYESADKVITVKRQETLEEVAHKMLDDYGIKSIGQSIGVLEVKKLMVKMAKWQAERMYEIMNAYTDDVMGGCNLRAEEWFEQNKNK